jgi:4-aminobutyrate aminotransferase
VTNRETKEKATVQAEKVMYECLRNGLSFKVSQGNVLTLAPALTIQKNELESAFGILENAIMKFS